MSLHRSLFAASLISTLSLVACSSPISSDAPTGDAGAPLEECPVPTKGPTLHKGEIVGSEVWTADASPHVVEYDVNVREGATLTIEPCVVVQLKKDKGIRVAYPITPNRGTLVAEGTASKPIRFEGFEGARWGNVFVHAPGKARLAWVTMAGGGGYGSPAGASLVVYGDGTLPSKHDVLLQHVKIEKSLGAGVRMDRGAAFDAASTDLVISGSGSTENPFPLSIGEHAIGTIPTGAYVGNAKDAILVEPETVDATLGLQEDATMKDHGVPYQIGTSPGLDHLRITGKKDVKTVTLTIEPGVTVKFLPKSAFNVEHFTGDFLAPAVLVAVGTKEKPITFTSAAATPAAGDWQGLWFGGKANPKNRIENVRIEYTGADCGCQLLTCSAITEFEGAVIFSMQPPTAFIKNTTFAHGSSHAIVNGYDGASPDFVSTNVFDDMAGCAQTLPRSASCPSPRPSCQ